MTYFLALGFPPWVISISPQARCRKPVGLLTYHVDRLEDIVQQCVVCKDGEDGKGCLGREIGHFLGNVRDDTALALEMRTDRLALGDGARVRPGAEHKSLERLARCRRVRNLPALLKLHLYRLLGPQFEECGIIVGECKDGRSAVKGLLEAVLVVEVRRHNLHSFGSERFCFLARDVSCGAPDRPAGLLEESVDDPSALASRRANNHDEIGHCCLCDECIVSCLLQIQD